MRIFLDANILVSVLNKEYPLFTHSSRIISLADHREFTVCTSALCLAIAYFFAQKKCGAKLARQKIALLASKLTITTIGEEEVSNSVQNKKILDFEDGLQYYSALGKQCTVIVTEDIDDFYFSEIEVLKAEDFTLRVLKGL
jgi:predicted nucleic acid-binding protein